MTSDDLVRCLEKAWENSRCLAHNWKDNPFPHDAVRIWEWCNAQVPPVDWGPPRGYPVQEAQRAERGAQVPRICAFQEPDGHQKIMFSLSSAHSPDAFSAAQAIAAANGFNLLVP